MKVLKICKYLSERKGLYKFEDDKIITGKKWTNL